MKITSIDIRKLHGYLDTHINLKPNIAILVGINGSGKTSTLNVINWMFNLSIESLSTESFETIEIHFIHEKSEYQYICRQTNEILEISLLNLNNRTVFEPIRHSLKSDPKSMARRSRYKEIIYNETLFNEINFNADATWNFIKNLPSPVIIGLDRTLYTSDRHGVSIQREGNFGGISRNDFAKDSSTPLENVSRLLSGKFTQHTNELLKLNRTLNETIVLSAFNEVYSQEKLEELLVQQTPSIKRLDKLRNQVIEFLKDNHNWNSRQNRWSDPENFNNIPEQRISNYFENLKDVIQNRVTDKIDLRYLVNVSQFRKVNELITAFSEFEQKTQDEIAPLNEFMAVLNTFFKDSSKQLYFEKESGLLRFNILDKYGQIITESMNVNSLSSGEKQILILLTYIKYRRENLFLIDEPELSLHPKWQEDFLNAINKLMRKNSQLIIATHSPEIIGDYRDNCSVLLPYGDNI
ncbi:AAA domain-containing protein, putative AbiEii toxin, Type IV TA system [Pedobacter sp. ok626]|uniref:AAA family ATPase n=1 Tax=Pedobacter sp. ok626 TaxID=1761882 RepID=UPI0008829D93|nr:AAA family ATPase [Pedobacter sp. ok626]SDK59012.1 AAA domain-containing protein, putative AbiEii toxin, Type IV TA system [Pedobacter sp. ok626]